MFIYITDISSIELIKFRNLVSKNPNDYRVHPPTATLLPQLIKSIASLQTLVEREPEILSSRAKHILKLCNQFVLKPHSTKEITHAL